MTEGAVPAEALKASFPPIRLPIQPPFPPMEAKLVEEIPKGAIWQYEPKWDGFRCLAFRKGDRVLLQSKTGQPLGRYFPEIVEGLRRLRPVQFVLDGEIAILKEGRLWFDDLLLRIHPAASRIQRLARETPATYLVFDLLVGEDGKSLVKLPLGERRLRLERLAKGLGTQKSIRLSPATRDYATARRWMSELAASGFDGIVAKQADCAYASGERSAMRKIKRIRTADCVVGGFRYASRGGEVGSLLLGLYDEDGLLNHVGFTSSFAAAERKKLRRLLRPHMRGPGFTGRAPGGPSRWSTERSGEWEPLDAKLVCEVRYDHFSGGRFRHGTKFLRWRPEKEPQGCTYEQVESRGRQRGLEQMLAA
ncbi:MAG TPA: ATP-dependent DNA ligase [Candidatus Binatia bacterium]|nr:ATP-dependent DNA ligase [Candidatus Binatia bacterium]